MNPRQPGPDGTTGIVIVVAGLSMLVFGFWAWCAPQSFADFTDFPVQVHFLHDAGVFQIAIGMTLLGSLWVQDSATVALTGFLIANTFHTANHVIDLPLGGHVSDPLILGALSLLAAFGLIRRVRRLTSQNRSIQ